MAENQVAAQHLPRGRVRECTGEARRWRFGPCPGSGAPPVCRPPGERPGGGAERGPPELAGDGRHEDPGGGRRPAPECWLSRRSVRPGRETRRRRLGRPLSRGGCRSGQGRL